MSSSTEVRSQAVVNGLSTDDRGPDRAPVEESRGTGTRPGRKSHGVEVDLTLDNDEVFSWLTRDPQKCGESAD